MKKPAILVGLLVAVLALAAGLGPWYTSRIADSRIATIVAALNRQGLFEAHYERTADNWFGQQGVLKLIPVDPRFNTLRRSGAGEIALHLSVAYGPIPFAAWGRDGVSLVPVGAIVDTRINGLEQALRKAGSGYRLRDVVELNGASVLTLRLAPGDITDQQGVHVQWSASELRLSQHGQRLSGAGHSGELTITRTGPRPSHMHVAPARLVINGLRFINGQGAGKIRFTWDGMQLTAPRSGRGTSMAFDVGALHLEVDSHLAQGISVGKANMSLAGLSVREPADATAPLFALQNMTLGSVTTEPLNHYTDSILRWKVADMVAGGERYAPGSVELRLEHQYVPALHDLVQALRSLRSELRMQPNLPPQIMMPRMMTAIAPSLQRFIEHRPVLRLTQLQLGTPQGELHGGGEARLVPANGASPTLATLPEDLVARLELDIPALLAQRLAAIVLERQGVPADRIASATLRLLRQLEREGFLLFRGGSYRLNFEYRNTALSLNGRPLRFR